ncbi:hypothetical protein [Novosphingobium sp.]|uniref:hypothetical protein n=1 Tax=Novosphingobium sp. TaxID=1874826 RepID=UPI00352329C5
MDILRKIVHEMFYTSYHRGARLTPVAQIADQAGIVRGKAAEFRHGHARALDEFFNAAEKHGLGPSLKVQPDEATRNRIFPMLILKSYNARKSPSKVEEGRWAMILMPVILIPVPERGWSRWLRGAA